MFRKINLFLSLTLENFPQGVVDTREHFCVTKYSSRSCL